MANRYRCRICLYIHESNEPIKRCPWCSVGMDEFEEIDQEGNVIVSDKSSATGTWYCSVCNNECFEGAYNDIPENFSCPECASWKELLRLR